jgi:hypothetical protein
MGHGVGNRWRWTAARVGKRRPRRGLVNGQVTIRMRPVHAACVAVLPEVHHLLAVRKLRSVVAVLAAHRTAVLICHLVLMVMVVLLLLLVRGIAVVLSWWAAVVGRGRAEVRRRAEGSTGPYGDLLKASRPGIVGVGTVRPDLGPGGRRCRSASEFATPHLLLHLLELGFLPDDVAGGLRPDRGPQLLLLPGVALLLALSHVCGHRTLLALVHFWHVSVQRVLRSARKGLLHV